MNNQSSPGFLYFKTNHSNDNSMQDKSNSGDFLAFSESSPHPNRFSPNHFSSPQNQRRNFFQDRRRNRRWSPQNNYCRSFNSSASYNNSSNNQSSSWKDEKDYSKYLHKSFMEDPWAELERNFQRQKEQNLNEVKSAS